MPDTKPQPSDECEAIGREQSRIVLACVVALAFLSVTFFLLRPPLTAVIVVAIVVLIGFKKAAVRHQELSRKKTDLRDSRGS